MTYGTDRRVSSGDALMPRLRHLLPCFCLSLLIAALAAVRADDPEDTTASDEKMLHERGIKTDCPGLLDFLRERSLSEEERAQMAQLVKQLGADDFEKREAASQTFVKRGRVSIPFLKTALNNIDPEIARRAQTCLDDISGGPGPALPAAA